MTSKAVKALLAAHGIVHDPKSEEIRRNVRTNNHGTKLCKGQKVPTLASHTLLNTKSDHLSDNTTVCPVWEVGGADVIWYEDSGCTDDIPCVKPLQSLVELVSWEDY